MVILRETFAYLVIRRTKQLLLRLADIVNRMIHSPNVIAYESLLFSSWLHLCKEIDKDTRKMFIEEVIELVEKLPVRNFIAVLHGMDFLSADKRKRLTIAIALVANPSILSRDEPTIGPDTRVAGSIRYAYC